MTLLQSNPPPPISTATVQSTPTAKFRVMLAVDSTHNFKLKERRSDRNSYTTSGVSGSEDDGPIATNERAKGGHSRNQPRPGYLRVIVGRGNHTSDGESSLPRVIENYFISNGYKYEVRGGKIDVRVQRRV